MKQESSELHHVIVKKNGIVDSEYGNTHSVSVFIPREGIGKYREFTLHFHFKKTEPEIIAWEEYETEDPNIDKGTSRQYMTFASIEALPMEWQRVIRIAEWKYWTSLLSVSLLSLVTVICISIIFTKEMSNILGGKFFWLLGAFPCSVLIWLYASTPARIAVKGEKRAIFD